MMTTIMMRMRLLEVSVSEGEIHKHARERRAAQEVVGEWP